MTENTDAPETIETEVDEIAAEAAAVEAEEVDEGQKGDEPSESSTETEAEDTEDKKSDGVTARIDELTRLRRQAERDAEYWRNQAMKKEPEPEVKAEPEPVKTLADFDYDEGAYQQHLFAKARAEAVEEAKRVLQSEQSQQTTAKKIAEFRNREADFSKDVEDYIDVVTNPSLPISQEMADVAMEMENGPEVLYYLGKNPAIADEISRLSPLSAARELGRIEAKLLDKKSGEKVSKAPAPTPKLKAVEASMKVSPDTADSDKLSTKDWMKMRNKQIMRK